MVKTLALLGSISWGLRCQKSEQSGVRGSEGNAEVIVDEARHDASSGRVYVASR